MLAITHTPHHKRPRELILTSGADSLSNPELVAALLGSGLRNSTIDTIAQKVSDFLQNGEYDPPRLKEIKGIGTAKAAVIAAALTLGKRLAHGLTMQTVSPQTIYESCRDIVEQTQEHLLVFYVSSRGQAFRRDVVSIGTLTASLVHPREVFRPAIVHNAAHIILAHNHPSGDHTPSEADLEATRTIAQAGKHLGIELIDHLVFSVNGFTSLKMAQQTLFW